MSRFLHKRDDGLFNFVRSTVVHYAEEFALVGLKGVSPLPKKKCHYFGFCGEDGQILIRVRRINADGTWHRNPDRPYQIIDTMAHELAHLRFQGHGKSWFVLHTAILSRMAQGCTYDKLREITTRIKDECR
jgi:hypothetical protein